MIVPSPIKAAVSGAYSLAVLELGSAERNLASARAVLHEAVTRQVKAKAEVEELALWLSDRPEYAATPPGPDNGENVVLKTSKDDLGFHVDTAPVRYVTGIEVGISDVRNATVGGGFEARTVDLARRSGAVAIDYDLSEGADSMFDLLDTSPPKPGILARYKQEREAANERIAQAEESAMPRQAGDRT